MTIARAKKLFRDFTGDDADRYTHVSVEIPETAIVIGFCDGLMYETVRDGKREKFVHRFKQNARPVLAVSADGKQLLLLDGSYRFTERGIVDRG